MSLTRLIKSSTCTPDELAAYLDGLTHQQRLGQLRKLCRCAQARLWGRVATAPALDLSHFVPPELPDQQEVIHHGRNTLPLFRTFEKRFCRPAGETDRLFGYNEGTTRALLGPGYFVTRPTAGNTAWEARGAVVVDYFQVPDAPVAPGWPAVVKNSQGGQRLVYHRTRDFMRRVSHHLSIGRAYKGELKLPSYFVLCREDKVPLHG